MNWKRNIWLFLILIFVVFQIIPSERPPVISNNPNDLLVNNSLPDSVSQIFRSACYDCHSNETVNPWYAYIAPVSWLVSRDVKLGRKKMNLSDWEANSKVDKAKILDEIQEEVEDGEMPMPIYILMHPKAKLTKQQRELIVAWSDEFAESLFE